MKLSLSMVAILDVECCCKSLHRNEAQVIPMICVRQVIHFTVSAMVDSIPATLG